MPDDDKPQKINIGFHGGQTLGARVSADELKKLRGALGGTGWHELTAEDGVVALDLANVEYVTSTILGHLVALNKRLHGAGGRLTLENVRPAVREILNVTLLDQVLDLR